jgi:putative transposase
MVKELRIQMPRLGTRKLYYLLSDRLNAMKVGRDKFFDILRANHLLIQPKRSYHVTTNSHHRFRKHSNLILDLEINRPEQVWGIRYHLHWKKGQTLLSKHCYRCLF